jgi:hypothetical protein
VAGVALALSFGWSPFYLFFTGLANSSCSNTPKPKKHQYVKFNQAEIPTIHRLRHP